MGRRLLDVMTDWLREEAVERKKRGAAKEKAGGATSSSKTFTPFMPSKHMAFFR